MFKPELVEAFDACKTQEAKEAFINKHPEYLMQMAKYQSMINELLDPSMVGTTVVLVIGILERFEKRLEKLEALLKGPAQ